MSLAKLNNKHSSFNIIDKIFDDIFIPFPFSTDSFLEKTFSTSRYPIRKNNLKNGTVEVEFDVPGYDKTNINLLYENETLHVFSKENNTTNDLNQVNKIDYKIYLPDLNLSTINATCDKGVLFVTASYNKKNNKHVIEIK